MTVVASDLRPTATPPAIRPGRPTLRRLLAWYALSRIVVWAAVLAGWTLRPDLTATALLRRLDASWYLDTALFGYAGRPATPDVIAVDPAALRSAFHPLWPLVARYTQPPGVPIEVSATVLATVLGFVVVVASWMLVARVADHRAADRAALLVCVFPGSFVLSVAYAEALMLSLAMLCLLALVDRRWWVAGVAAALATAARPNALALLPACLWAAGTAIARRGEWRSVIAPLLAPLGAVGFHVFLWWRTGSVDAWDLAQRNGWDERIDFGAGTIERLGTLLRWADPDPGTVLLGLGLLTAFAGAWASWRWRPPAVLSVYAGGVVGLALMAHTLGPRPRFVFTALPLVWALGVQLRGERFNALVGASTAGLAMLSVVYIVGSIAKP